MASPLTVMIVDRRLSACRELRETLLADTGIDVVATASTIRDAIECVEAFGPRIVILADRRNGLRGLVLLAAMRRKRPTISCIVIAEQDDLETRVNCVEAGADGLVVRGAPTEEIGDTLRAVASGENVLQDQAMSDPAMMQRLLQQVRQSPGGRRPMNRFDPNLSPCLLGVLDGVVQGWSNRVISDAEGIAEQTVKHHIANLKQRLGVWDRIGLVRHAVLREWAQMEPADDRAVTQPMQIATSGKVDSPAVVPRELRVHRSCSHARVICVSA